MTLDLTNLYKAGDPANIEGGIKGGIYWVGDERLHGWFTFGATRLLAAWFPDGSVKAGIETPRLLPPRPWYPASWLGADGNPLPGVHEHTPGTWPTCGPGDRVEVLLQRERDACQWDGGSWQADSWCWRADVLNSIVAYRVLSEGEQ